MKILEKVQARLKDEPADVVILRGYVETIVNRLCIRLGEAELPETFEGIAVDATVKMYRRAYYEGIAVDATVKMYRRAYYEGIASEGSDGISTSFVSDVLAEYADEIKAYRQSKSESGGKYKVYFL